MKNKSKNSFIREKLYVSVNSSICKNPILNIKRFHPIKMPYSPINTIESNIQDDTEHNKDIEYILKQRKNGSYKISSKRNFKTIIFQNWNTKNHIPTEIGNCLNFPVIMDRKQIIKNLSPNVDYNNLKYEYYYPVSNRKDLMLPSDKKEERIKRYNRFNSQDKGWKLITNYFYKNKKERDLEKRKLLKMKLTAKNLSVLNNKANIEDKDDKNNENIIDENKKIYNNTMQNTNKNDNNKNIDKNKMNKTNYDSGKIIKENYKRTKSKTSIKTLDLEKVEEKRNKKDSYNNINTISKAYSSSISNQNKILETKKTENDSNSLIIEDKDNKKNITNLEKDNADTEQIKNNYDEESDLDKSIDWEFFEDYKNLENNQFLYAIKKGRPLSYHLIDFKGLKEINEIEMKEKYYKHKLNKTDGLYNPKHSQDVFIINYMTISLENVVIYVNGKPENYNINEFRSLFLNYKTLLNIPIFKFWTRSKIFKLWVNYVRRQRRKKYEKKLKGKLHILDKPIVEGIKNIKQLLRDVAEINIFRLNSKEAKFPNQFVMDYQEEIKIINKEFENYRSKIKEIIKNMCEEEVHDFMMSKKMLDTYAVREDNNLLMKIETQKNSGIKNKSNKNSKDINKDSNSYKDTFKDDNYNKKDNKNKENKTNSEKKNNYDYKNSKFNYKLNNKKKILKNINIPEDLYKNVLTKEEKFKKQFDEFIKNETVYAQISTKRNFYCKILKIIRIIDHFFNESKKKAVYRSLSLLYKKMQKFYEFYKNNLNIFPLLKISIINLGNDIKYSPDFNNLEELFFEKFIQENIFNFINKKNFIDPQEFPIYMTCYELVFEKSFDQNASLLARIKSDNEINDLINNIKEYFYKIGEEVNKKIDELKIILEKYYKYSKINFKEFEENSTSAKIQEYLDYVYEEREKTIVLKKINNIGIFELNIEQLLELITDAPNEYINKVKNIVPNILKKKQTNLINLLNESIEEISKEVKNVEGFIKLKHSFENCKKNRYRIDEIEAEISDFIEIMNNKKNRMQFDQSNLENQSFLRILNLHYEELFQKISYDIENNIKKYKDILIINIKAFDKELNDVAEQLNNEIINKYSNNFNDTLMELKGLNIKINTLKEKKDIFLEEANELELEENYKENINRIDKLINEFDIKKEVWKKTKEFETFIKDMKNKEVIKLNINILEEKFTQCINLCENSLESLYNFSVPKTLIDKINPYKRLLDIIKVIQNPVVLNNETKFEELKTLLNLNNSENSKYIDIYSGTFSEKFTLEALKNLNIINIEKFIEFNKISNEEERLRIFIKNKYDEINIRKLKYKFKKNLQNTMTYITMKKNIEDNEYEFIENNIMLLRKESLNPCAWVISKQLNQLLNNYERYRKFMILINIYNQKIKEIDGVLLSAEFLKEYPSENKKILKENEFRYLIKLLQDNKYLSKFFQDNVYNKIISCVTTLIDSIEKNIYAIYKFIDKRKMESPQYYIMSNQEIIYLYSHRKDNIFLKKIIKKLYPWVRDIVFSYNIKNNEDNLQINDNYGNDEYIKINTVDDEIFLLKNIKGLRELKDYIDIIYTELGKRMKEHFKAHKKNNEVIYRNKSSKRLNDILKSVINEINKNLLIQEIFICIYFSIMDNIEKSLKSEDIFDKLFELYNICRNDIITEIIGKVNNEQSIINKKKYFCLLSLFNYIIGMLENLMHDDVQSPYEFSFIKNLNPKIESDTLIFYILGNLCTVEYGFEYTGIINNYLLLLSNEKIFIEIMNSYEFFRKPIIINTNHIQIGNNKNYNNNSSHLYDNVSILGSFLGKNIKDYYCNYNTDINVFKNLLCSYNKCGPWIRFNNVHYLKSVQDFEIISSQIVEVYYQIKYSEEEFITMNNGNKILINNKSFNVIVDLNSDDFENYDVKNSLCQNIYHYYRSINYIQINIEYFIKIKLINIGFKYYELIMNKILLILNYIYYKLYNGKFKLDYSLFVYKFFNLIINRIINNKSFHIQNINEHKNNNNINNNNNNSNNNSNNNNVYKNENIDFNNLNSLKEYENNIVYKEIKEIIVNSYQYKIKDYLYINIMNNLDYIFNVVKEEKKTKSNKDKDKNKDDNSFTNIKELNTFEEDINIIVSKYEISTKTNYYNKILQLILNFDKFDSYIIFGPSLSGKTILFNLFLSLIERIKNKNEVSIKINNIAICPEGTPEFFENFSSHKIFTFFNENKINIINDILTDLYENGNKCQLYDTSLYSNNNKNEIKDNISINSNDSENSEKMKENSKKIEILNFLTFNGKISSWIQYLLKNNEFSLIKDEAINKIFFETNDIKNLNQSLLTNENIFYVYVSNENSNGLNWENIVSKYINTECNINYSENTLNIKLYIKGLFFKYFIILKDFINSNIHSVDNECINQNFILYNLINFFDTFLNINCKDLEEKANTQRQKKKKQKNNLNEEEIYKKYVLYIFIFSFSWVIKNFINISYIAKIEQIVNNTFRADDLKTPILDYYVNPIKKEFDLWTNLLENKDLLNMFIKIDNKDLINNQMIEPLYKEKIILLYIISNLIQNNQSLYLNYINYSNNSNILNSLLNDKKYKTLNYNICSNTIPYSIVNYFNLNLINIHRNIYGDIYGRKITIFIDDVNINSSIDNFFVQLLEKRFYFNKNYFDFNFIYNFSLIFIGKKDIYPLKNSLLINKLNVLNCHINYTSIFLSIYKIHLDNIFKNYYLNFSAISSQYINVLCKLYEEIHENKDSNINFNFDDIEQIITNILKINCPLENESKYLFDKILTRYYFYSICRITYDNLSNLNDKTYLKQIICTTYNKIFKKVKITIEDIFENNEFLNGKISDFIFTHIDLKNNGTINEDKIFEYNKIEFYKNFINQKLKEFNNAYNDNIYNELIINDNDYEYLQNILFFTENNLKNKNILILLEGNKLFKELIFKFSAFLSGGKIIECKNDINSSVHLNKIFEEIILNNKKIFYYIKENILSENENSFYFIQSILIPEKFMTYIDIKKYKKEYNINDDNILELIKNNLKIVLDIQNYKNIKDIKYINKYYSYILDNSHIIHQSNWVKKDYKFYLDYYFSKYNTIKDIKSSSNYNNIKKNLFEIIYNTYLFSNELINKINNNTNQNINLSNNYTEAIQIFLNKYEINYNIIKEKYLIYDNCNPSHKIMNLIKKINSEIYVLGSEKEELEIKENNYKKQKQALFAERQNINKIILEYERKIEDKNIIYLSVSDEFDNIVNPIIKYLSKFTEECLIYNDISLNEVKHSYENSNLGKLILMSIFSLSSENNNEMNHNTWDLTKKNLNIKMLNGFFEKKVYANKINDKSYIKIIENIYNNNEFQQLINNLNNEKYKKPPFISLKKFCKYFNECYNYYKGRNKINELNKKISEIKKDIDVLKSREKEEKNKLNENKVKSMDIENQIISVEKEKNKILFNIKCHNDLMSVTKSFFENLDDIIPELLKKRKIYQDILSHYVSYQLFISLYYSFAPIFDKKNRVILQKYIYNQINKYNKNEIKEFTFLEIYYNFLDIIHNNETDINNNKTNINKPVADSIYEKNINFLLSLYNYLDINYLSISDDKNFILENIIFIDCFKNRAICLQNDKNPGISNLIVINLFKEQEKKEDNGNTTEKNKINDNIANDFIFNNENWLYRIIDINLNKNKLEKDLEYISKIINEGYHSRNKKLFIFIINNINNDNIYLFEELINNSDIKKRASTFYIGKNKILVNNQVYFKVFFTSKELNYNFSLNPHVTNCKFINFNVNSKLISKELKLCIGKISDIKFVNLLKENKIKLIKLYLDKEKYYKRICEIINKYEYETSENNYINDKKLLTDIEIEIKKLNNKISKSNNLTKYTKKIKGNLDHLNTLCIHGGKLYKLIQKYYKSFSFNELKILIEQFYCSNEYDKFVKDNENSNNNSSSIRDNEQEEEEESYDKEENSEISIPENLSKYNYIQNYTKNDLPLLINYIYYNKIENLIIPNNLNIINFLKIIIYLYYLTENNEYNKNNKELNKKIISEINNLFSNTITVETNEISPLNYISNENWNKLIYLSKNNNNIYTNVIKNIRDNTVNWKNFLSKSNNEIYTQIKELLNNNDNIFFNILIIISFIYPIKFNDIKEYLMNTLYNNNLNSFEKQYTLKGYIWSLDNPFNFNQKPLILMETNKYNLEQKIQYIKLFLYPKLLSIIKTPKGLSFIYATKSSSKVLAKVPNSHASSNVLISSNDKSIQNNNLMNIDNKENAVKFMIIKENIKNNNFDNIIQFVKTGGLIIINNVTQLDQAFIIQILNTINDAKSNKSIDKTFRLIFTLSEPFINDNINEILLKNCVYFNIDLFNDLHNITFKNKILENIKNIHSEIILFFSLNIFRKKILINLIFLNSLLKELSENEFYFNIYEIWEVLYFVIRHVESNDLEYKVNNINYGINNYNLIQFVIDNFFISKFTLNDEQSRIKNYIVKLLLSEEFFINDNNYLLFFDNGKFVIKNNNESIDILKLYNLFNNISDYEYNNIILSIKQIIFENKQIDKMKYFYRNIKYANNKQQINILKINNNIKNITNNQINEIFTKYLQKIPDNIIIPLDEEINDENISKNLFKKEKKMIFVNPLDELLLEEILILNNEINTYRKYLQKLIGKLNKNLYIKEDIIKNIIKENNIDNNINYIVDKYNFYKNWIKEGELKEYKLQYINNIKLFFHLLKLKHYKNEILLYNKNKKETNINNNELYKIIINYSPIKLTNDSIEITGLSFNLNKKYELILNDNNCLTITKKKSINETSMYNDKLFINFVEDDDNKYREFINNKNVFQKLNQDLPLIKDQYENKLDYGIKRLHCDFYQIINNSLLKINDSKEKIIIDISKEIDNESMNEIILNDIYFYVNNSHQLIINQAKN